MASVVRFLQPATVTAAKTNASSDHLVVDPGPVPLAVGAEVAFQLDYSALLRAMTSPFVTRVMTGGHASSP